VNVISVSTIPPRFAALGPTLESLLAQTAPIDRIILNVARRYRRFPDHDGSLPKVPDGIEVVLVDEDLGPATKVLPTVAAYRGQDVNILFCDDDMIYLPNWAKELLDAAQSHPNMAICNVMLNAKQYGLKTDHPDRKPRATYNFKRRDLAYRLKRIWSQLDVFKLYTSRRKPARLLTRRAGFADIFQGYGGVLVRPEFFDDLVFDIPEKLWAVDDVWLSGHLARKQVPIWVISTIFYRVPDSLPREPLVDAVIDGLDRQASNAACIRYFQQNYGIWTGRAAA